jgi:hypothetical protein
LVPGHQELSTLVGVDFAVRLEGSVRRLDGTIHVYGIVVGT